MLVKELLWPHFCFITPNLPLNIYTRVCEVTYGVIVRCQWAFTHSTLTRKHSMEHSKPLMSFNGEWHQTCHVSCYFSLFLFHFSLSLFVTPPLFELMCIHGHKWRSQLLLACALMDLVGSRGCDGWSDFVQHLPSVGSRLGGKKKKENWLKTVCQKKREDGGGGKIHNASSSTSSVSDWLHFHCCVWLSFFKKLPKLWRKTSLVSWKCWHVLMCVRVHETCHFSDSGSDFLRIV